MRVHHPRTYERNIGYLPRIIRAGMRKAKQICRVIGTSHTPVAEVFQADKTAVYVYLELTQEEYEAWAEYDRYKDWDLPVWCREIIDTWPRAGHHKRKHTYVDGYYSTDGPTNQPYDGLERVRRVGADQWAHERYRRGEWVRLA